MTHPERRYEPAGAATASLSVCVIIPFHDNLHYLSRCLSSLRPLPPQTTVIIAADRAPHGCHAVARRYGARVVDVPAPGGPACARNFAAAMSSSELLIFIDADVIAPSAALRDIVREFVINPEIAAAFGTYDDEPGCRNFASQYKNLTHAFIHRSADRAAQTFWAGFGAVRTKAFRSVGGFDPRFERPCIEDIELGVRLTAAGHRVVIDRRLHVCHLKRWTLRSMVVSDIRDRGVPWTRLIFRSRRFPNALNIDHRARASVALTGIAGINVGVGMAVGSWLAAYLAVAAVAAVIALNRELFVFLMRRRGKWFALRAVPVNLLYHLCNGLSFVMGAVLHCADLAAPLTSRSPRRTVAES
jgi:hypothetical protein